ncbi:MAG: phosphoenolpyruvate carboxylase [Akkermansiaceae bacterium]
MNTSTESSSSQEIREANLDYRRDGFQELESRLATLMDMLKGVLGKDAVLSSSIPWRGEDIRDQSTDPKNAASIAQLQAICFEILNMVEERTSRMVRHRRRNELGNNAEKGLWGRVIAQLQEEGLTEDAMLAALPDLSISPVLTAHPTESKRATVRERHLALYNELVRWDLNKDDPGSLDSIMESINVCLETLWHTGEIHASRPSILGELRNVIYYLREVFPNVLKKLDTSLESAWQAAGWDVQKLRDAAAYPKLKFGTWVGGDRDGHPLVTADVTADTLKRLRKHAFRIHERELKTAADILTLSPDTSDIPEVLTARIAEIQQEIGDMGDRIATLNAMEPWRCLAYLMREKLDSSNQCVAYARVEEYLADIDLLNDTLISLGAATTARNVVHPLRRLAEVFGFHLATIDIRQNSPFHDSAAAQMLAMAGVEDAENFPTWPEQKRVEFLTQELQNPRPFKPWQACPDSEAGKVMACMKVLRDHATQYGFDSFGLYVVSMTRQVSDILLVHLFTRESNMAAWKDGIWSSIIPASPLFETGADLDNGADIVKAYLSIPSGKSFLRESTSGLPYMPVMVGYSDSTKDSGLLSGQWSLQKAQAQITNAALEMGARCEFFHGRGGTISRGAGPVQWFLRSLPSGSLTGSIRITEQGEVIPRKYAHRSSAAYNLELLVAGVARVSIANQNNQISSNAGDADYVKIMQWLATESRAGYRSLLEEPDFMKFYRQATPLDALENGCFGSRPASRTGTATLDDLRAIPWVFSWTQARYYLPGWFGVGTGLEKLKQERPDDFATLAAHIQKEPFLRYLLTNVETNLVSANLELMTAYADLVTDTALRDRFQDIIVPEFHRTGAMIDEIFGSTFAERRPKMLRTLKMRDLPLRLLHQQQISLLSDWRKATASGDTQAAAQLLNALQFSVNAIASGLRTTG